MIDTASHASIRYAFQNVQKSRKTMHDLLETLKNSVDFLFIQESPINFVCKVPSTTSEAGDDLVGLVIHHNWQCVNKCTVQSESQVAIYINIHFTSTYQLFPILDPNIDPGVLAICVRHNTMPSLFFHVINIYNWPGTRHSAIESLLRLAPTLTNIAVIQGDFNLHSPLWDPAFSNASGLGEHLFYSLSDLELNLGNNDGDATWTNRHSTCSVIDLVFYSDILARISPQTIIDIMSRGHSNHAVIFLAFSKQSPHWG